MKFCLKMTENFQPNIKTSRLEFIINLASIWNPRNWIFKQKRINFCWAKLSWVEHVNVALSVDSRIQFASSRSQLRGSIDLHRVWPRTRSDQQVGWGFYGGAHQFNLFEPLKAVTYQTLGPWKRMSTITTENHPGQGGKKWEGKGCGFVLWPPVGSSEQVLMLLTNRFAHRDRDLNLDFWR